MPWYERVRSARRKLRSLVATIEVLSSEEETRGLLAGIKDAREGRTTRLSEIRNSLMSEAGGSSHHRDPQDR
jgi:hypothetical protein